MVKFKPDEAGTLEYSDVHGDIFGTGIPLSVYMKALLKQIAFNLEEMFDGRKRLEWNDNAEAWPVFRNRTYKQLTGFEWTRVTEINTELRKNAGRLQPKEKTGPKARDLEQEYPRLRQWLEDEAKKANRGGFLTVEKLQASFKLEFPLSGPVLPGAKLQNTLSKEMMRKALLSCDFQYTDRKLKRLEARESPRVLQELDRTVKWFVEHSTYIFSDISGKHVYKFTRPVAFTDESYKDGGEYRPRSWTNANTRTRDQLKKSVRITLLHSIFSGCNPNPLPCRYWNSDWKKKHPGHPGGEFYGKCNGEIIENYYIDVFHAFGNQPQADQTPPVLITDNARMHKRIRKELRECSAADILDWCVESNEVSEETQTLLEKLNETAPAPAGPTRAALLKALLDAGVNIYEITSKAQLMNCVVMFLPPYYSEMNAIELLWAEIKRVYRDTDTSLSWEERMALAVNSITPQFIESCVDRCIRWARRKYSERIAPLQEVAAPTRCLRNPDCT